MRLQLRSARDTREKYDQNRKELLAGISHDLSTPLTKIEGYASGIVDGIANTPEKRHHYLTMIQDTSRHMAKLVQTLFLFSKLDLGQIPFHWETVDIGAYVADYVGEQGPLYESQGLSVRFTSAVDKAEARLDRSQFQRVLENILSNSLKYKDQDRGQVEVSLKDDGDQGWLLTVADDGRGVDDADLTKIFESFYRSDKARSNVAKGSGLGLAVVQQIVLAMGGTIWARHTEPKGLTICIRFPKGEA